MNVFIYDKKYLINSKWYKMIFRVPQYIYRSVNVFEKRLSKAIIYS